MGKNLVVVSVGRSRGGRVRGLELTHMNNFRDLGAVPACLVPGPGEVRVYL